MHIAIKWTETMDATLRERRASGANWTEVGAALGIGREAARERGRRIGAPAMVRPPRPKWDEALQNRPPLPAGHPISWGLLIDGTCIEGSPYPYPVFI